MSRGLGLSIKIGADTTGAIRGISKVNKALGDKLTGAEKFKASIDKAFLPAVGVLGAVGTAAFASAQKASDLAETQSKVGQIFGDASKELQAWSAEAPTALGQTQAAALDAASTMATFGKAAGLTGTELTDFSKQTVNLSSDLASFYNTDPAEAVNALGSALRGEYEPLRRFGVLLDTATLEARAMEMGIYDGNGALTQQQKTLAAQAEIMAQTTDAQGDFARTADGAANQQRILKATLEQTQTEMGAALLPVLEKVSAAFSTIAGWARENQTLFMVLVGAVTALAAAIVAIKIAMTVATAVQWAWNAALNANPIGLIVLAIAALIAILVLAYNNVDWFREAVDAAWAFIKDAIDVVVTWFQETAWPIIKKIVDFIVGYYKFLFRIVKAVFTGIKTAIEAVVNWFQDTAWPIIETVIDLIVGYWEFLAGIVSAVWSGIETAIANVVNWFDTTVVPIIEGAVNVVAGIWRGLRTTTRNIWNGIEKAVNNVLTWFDDNIGEKIRTAVEAGADAFRWLRDTVQGILDAIETAVRNAIGFITDKIDDIKNAVSNIPVIGGLVSAPAPAPTYGLGATRGTSYAATGTRLIGGGGLGSVTVVESPVNITVNGALDPPAVARQIRKILKDANVRERVKVA